MRIKDINPRSGPVGWSRKSKGLGAQRCSYGFFRFFQFLNQKFHLSGTKTSRCTIMRVLIADDQKSVGTTLAHLVSECNHEVVEVVGSGLEAIQAYSRHNPDVVLMDYWMSKLNGGTACRNILAKDPSARVILVSAWSHLSELESSGAIRVLSKPVDIDQLESALNEAYARPTHCDERTETELFDPEHHFESIS